MKMSSYGLTVTNGPARRNGSFCTDGFNTTRSSPGFGTLLYGFRRETKHRDIARSPMMKRTLFLASSSHFHF
jgi:hypothetical protein